MQPNIQGGPGERVSYENHGLAREETKRWFQRLSFPEESLRKWSQRRHRV